jgi:hypothetical protein
MRAAAPWRIVVLVDMVSPSRTEVLGVCLTRGQPIWPLTHE